MNLGLFDILYYRTDGLFAGLIVLFVLAIICTVLICVLILPANKRENLPNFFKFLHDLFHFKVLFVEYLLKILYVFCTIFVAFMGIFLLLSQIDSGGLLYLLYALIYLVFFRIVYELLMMGLVLVRNVIEINKKLTGSNQQQTKESQVTPEPEMIFCGHCGFRYEVSQEACPKCHEQN